MFWRILASIIVGVIVWLVAPLVGGLIETLQFSPAVVLGAWIAGHAEILGVLAAFAYFIWGRWFPRV
jgi:hypothetical protein